MPPRGRNRGGGGRGKQAHAGRGRGSNQERRNTNVIDLTEENVGASTFGLPSMNPFMMSMTGMTPMGFPMINPFMPLGMSTLLGPQTAGVFAPLGATQTGDSNSNILAMQQQMMMQQWMSQMNGSSIENSVQVKMSHVDLQAIKMHKMQQQFAMLKAMQDQYSNSQKPQASAKESSATGSDMSGDAEDDEDDPPPDREMIDVVKHQAKQNEIDRRMAETISTFMAKEEHCTDPIAALKACREATREATA